jgi:ABC-type bacteriocin/lantibiotic exporter with double-glycine peptidase domain
MANQGVLTVTTALAKGKREKGNIVGWTNVTLHNGLTVALYKQRFANDCGPSCVATVGRLFGMDMDIEPARKVIGSVDYKHPPSIQEGCDWIANWAYMTALTQALSSYGVDMAYTLHDVPADKFMSFCEARHQKSPAILRVEWANGDGHFVVTVGKNGATQQDFIEILDPAHGYQRVSLSKFPIYMPRDPITHTKVAEGTLDRYWSVKTA